MIDRCFDANETFMGRDKYFFFVMSYIYDSFKVLVEITKECRVSSCHVSIGNVFLKF